MKPIKVVRVYKVELEEGDLAALEQRHLLNSAVDAITRLADAGELYGTLYCYKTDRGHEWDDDYVDGVEILYVLTIWEVVEVDQRLGVW